jgi:hypothetical protein
MIVRDDRAWAWGHHAHRKQCVLCGAAHPQGHHVIKQQVLRKACGDLELDYQRVRWDLRNLMPLCDRHHVAHHSRRHPIELEIVLANCPKIVQFATELELVWWLSREYPVRCRR